MTVVLGLVLGLGLLLVASPWLWPANIDTERRRGGSSRRVRDELALAGLGNVPVFAVVAASVLLGVVGAALAQAGFALSVLTLIGGVVGAGIVPVVVRTRAQRRRAANRAVWPDIVDHLVASVRAGMSLPEALGGLADLGPTSTRSAFANFADDYRRSASFAVSVDSLKARLADPIADRILETLRMAREVGGNDVTNVLRGLAGYLREDAALRAEVAARQSWIRNAARLGVAAPWLLLAVLASRRETLVAYDSAAGTLLIVVGVAVSLLAYQLMVMLGRLPEERRWFL